MKVAGAFASGRAGPRICNKAKASAQPREKMTLRARMKPGVRPIVLNGSYLAPEHPTYWEVPASDAAAVEMLVADGQVEYEREFTRGANGAFAVPGLETVKTETNASKFARRTAKGK